MDFLELVDGLDLKECSCESVLLQLARFGETICLGNHLRVTQGIQNVGTRANFPKNSHLSSKKYQASIISFYWEVN